MTDAFAGMLHTDMHSCVLHVINTAVTAQLHINVQNISLYTC